MSIGDWDEGTLRRFIEDTMGAQPQLITQLQGLVLRRAELLGAVAAGKKVIFNILQVVMFINGTQTNTTTVAHGLGVIPLGVWMPSFYQDGGHFVCHVGYGGAVPPPDATNFQCFAWDRLAGAHGPGNLGAVPALAIGLGAAP